MKQAGELGADEVVALDDEAAMARVGLVDAVADAVGHTTAERLLGKVKQGGVFASVLGVPGNAKMHPTVRVAPLMVEPNAAKHLRIPIDRMMPLAEAGAAQASAEKGGIGKIILVG